MEKKAATSPRGPASPLGSTEAQCRGSSLLRRRWERLGPGTSHASQGLQGRALMSSPLQLSPVGPSLPFSKPHPPLPIPHQRCWVSFSAVLLFGFVCFWFWFCGQRLTAAWLFLLSGLLVCGPASPIVPGPHSNLV